MIAKADLHVHSKYSDHPSTFGHKIYKSPESFTEVETVYRQAKSRGMDFVTLTDHDDIRGSLELVAKRPFDCFISCEVTTYFPEDRCKAHILVYGITEAQYSDIMSVAKNIVHLRDYLAKYRIAYSVAHATYDQDGKLSFEHIEKLVVLFDVFEVINGGADSQNNLLLHRYLMNLNQETLRQLQAKHQLNSISTDPWVKGFTGGSDDHCGILIGSAFTQYRCDSLADFLDGLRNKETLAGGLHGSFETYATGVIKHIHDYRLDRDRSYRKTKMNDFLELFFSGREGNLIRRFKKSQSLRFLKKKNTKTHKALAKLLTEITDTADADMKAKIPGAYFHICELHDEMFSAVISALSKHLPSGDIFKALNRLGTLFPMTLLAAPFVGSMRHQVLKSEIKQNLLRGTRNQVAEKALWFTDTIDDLNGVSVTLRQIARHSQIVGYQLRLVTCVNEDTLNAGLPTDSLNLHPVKEIEIPGYESQRIGFPSLLKMMRKIIQEQPDQIIISTPGPLGLGALLCAKLMDLPVKMIYHTDFAEQIFKMTNEPTLANATDYIVNAFYKQADEVFVPSQAYIDKLAEAGLPHDNLKIFPRGLDLDLYRPINHDYHLLRRHQLHSNFTLLFAGRISEDKNLGLLSDIYNEIVVRQPDAFNLVIAGDGPDLSRLKARLDGQPNVVFTGRLSPEDLVEWYCNADLLVFPSHTDTFGMVVLEAQACGIPCLVTASGGPKEIINPGVTGHVIESESLDEWIAAIEYYRLMKHENHYQWMSLSDACVQHVQQQNDWRPVFEAVLGEQCRIKTPAGAATSMSLTSRKTQPVISPISKTKSDQAA